MIVNKKRTLRNNQICEIILDYLKENDSIVKKENLVKKFVDQISLSTIYRGINRLLKKGLVIAFQVNNEKYVAQVNDKLDKSLFFVFFVCEICKQTFRVNLDDTELNKINQKIKYLYNFDTKFTLFEFHGICKNCLTSNRVNLLSVRRMEDMEDEDSNNVNR